MTNKYSVWIVQNLYPEGKGTYGAVHNHGGKNQIWCGTNCGKCICGQYPPDHIKLQIRLLNGK